MNRHQLAETVATLLAPGKGLLAMDESIATCNHRFAAEGIAQTVLARRAWRELLLSAPGLGDSISGVILHDETFHQHQADGTPFTELARRAGLVVGIKVDAGTTPLPCRPDERVTEGLDGLRQRLQAYAAAGARFAKWRAVFAVGSTEEPLPSPGALDANALNLARYAALCQEAGLVPVVEPEVSMAGHHTLQQCEDATSDVLHAVFAHLPRQGVVLESIILKPNMVLPGAGNTTVAAATCVADATLRCLQRSVPAAVPGVAFLSGGQDSELATSRLNAMHPRHAARGARPQPWVLTFSFARALQQPAMARWAGQDEHRTAAQQILLHRARCNAAALRGDYRPQMEEA